MAPSAAFESLLNQKTGIHTKYRILWKLDGGDQDITRYFISCGAISQEKERAPDRLTAGDATLIFDNASGAFTETSSSSFLYGVNYHNRNISIEVGMEMADGTIEYYKATTMKVASVNFASDNDQITVRVYDIINRLLNDDVNSTPSGMVAAAGGSNVGNGRLSTVATKPFATTTQNWTLTCTTPGGAGVAVFSVVGSVAGNIGNATDGTEFSSATYGLKFTIQAGTVNWAGGDTVTFSTYQTMEWTAVNPVKIIWSILTGYNWDTNVQEAWYARTPQLDHTQSTANTDIDYAAFASAITIAATMFTITGFIPWDYKLTDAIEEILLHFLGAFPIDGSGRISIKIFIPQLPSSPRNFADTKKVRALGYIRDTRDTVNSVSVRYRKLTNWPWSTDNEISGLDGVYVAKNQASHDALGQWYVQDLVSRWYNATSAHVIYLTTRLVDKYGTPPRRFTLLTGIDGIEQQLGDEISVTDEKLGFTSYFLEVVKKDGALDKTPIEVVLEADDAITQGLNFAFLGSSANEGDGISPQAATYDLATVNDKQFCYMSQTGGSGSPAGPDYYNF